MDSRVQVRTQSGVLEGLVCHNEADSGREYFRFLGIPYAKPPIGDLRFKAPQPIEPWEGVKDATNEGPQCYSRDLFSTSPGTKSGSEDCLSLNVYTPKLPIKTGDEIRFDLKPVMVFIHGGAFTMGSSSRQMYDPEYLLREDVVFVSINYRTGVLGFLSLKDAGLGVPGNAGFKDMVLALKWFRDNIRSFNGDRENVTIFGESAGGASVHLLVLSPLAKGLFHKAIAQSGCALNPWVHAAQSAPLFANHLGINEKDEKALLEALQGMSVQELHDTQYQLLPDVEWKVSDQRHMGYTVENPDQDGEHFLTMDPFEIMMNGEYHQVPLLLGFNSREGIAIYMSLPNQSIDMEHHIPYVLDLKKNPTASKDAAEKIRRFYFGNHKPLEEDVDDLYKLLTDNFFTRDIYRSALLHSKTSSKPIFLYEMTLETPINFMRNLFGITSPGVCHADDLSYLFKMPTKEEIKPNSPADIGIRRFCRLWTNFAKYGDPNSPEKDSLIPVRWQPFTFEGKHYLEIGENLKCDINPVNERMEFWNSFFSVTEAGEH